MRCLFTVVATSHANSDQSSRARSASPKASPTVFAKLLENYPILRRKSIYTYAQSFGVFKSATTTSFQPWIFDSFCTCSVGEAIEVTTIHLSYVSPAGGGTFFSIFVQFTFSFNFPSFATACQWIAVSLWVTKFHRPLRFGSAQELAAENL